MIDEILKAVMTPGTPLTYAPRFRVVVDGQKLGNGAIRDVLSISVVLDTENASSFRLKVNNSDEQAMLGPKAPGVRFPTKYTDTSTFDIGNRIRIDIGYGHAILPMFFGQITGMTPRFPATGAATLDITGEDDMVRLRDQDPAGDEHTRVAETTDLDLIRTIGQKTGLPVQFHSTDAGMTHRELVRDADDISTLFNRARRMGLDCFVRTDPSGETSLRVVPRAQMVEQLGGNSFPLVWGQNLIDFSPTINASRQVSTVTARGWDPASKQVIEHVARPSDLSLGPRSGPEVLAGALGMPKNLQLSDYDIGSQQEARVVAQEALRSRAEGFVTGTLNCMGNPFMRAGDGVDLGGLGRRFDGRYVIKKVTHTLDGNGYRTQAEVSRSEDGGIAGGSA